jgi:hypothetical protein
MGNFLKKLGIYTSNNTAYICVQLLSNSNVVKYITLIEMGWILMENMSNSEKLKLFAKLIRYKPNHPRGYTITTSVC